MRIYDAINYHKNSNKHFFNKSAMRFFNSRICYNTWLIIEDYGYFVTSEKYNDLKRKYTIRRINLKTYQVNSVSEFQEFNNRQTAERNIINYAFKKK